MTGRDSHSKPGGAGSDAGGSGPDRAERLSDALRANLARRKAQARARRAEDRAGDAAAGDVAAGGDEAAAGERGKTD
ncbi:MAG: hypothetical protein AAF074_21300 [Pseudomonadota bacterium]